MRVLIASIFWTGFGALLFQAQLMPTYLPRLLLWTGLGALLSQYRVMPAHVSKLLGRSLYWFGVPLQIFMLVHRSGFSQAVWLSPVIMGLVLVVGFGIAGLILNLKPLILKKSGHQIVHGQSGSYILASILGNVSFVGLSVVPTLVHPDYWGWIALYSVAHTMLGSYGLGILTASYFGRKHQERSWQAQLRDMLLAPPLWAFVLGCLTRHLAFPEPLESGLQNLTSFVSFGAFILIGLQLNQIKEVKNLSCALIPVILKLLILPGLLGLWLSLIGVTGDARLALVLMSGMPTAFANVILAEEFNLDAQVATSSILLSTLSFPLATQLWLLLLK
jgi:predicted permease